MANRTSRHQKPGDKNLRGKKSKRFCPCCDDVVNHKEKILVEILEKEKHEELSMRKLNEQLPTN